MGVKVYDNATQQVIEVDPGAAADGISAGKYTAAQKKIRVKREGQTGQVDASQLANARGHGWEVTDEAGAQAARDVIEAHSTGSQIRGGAEAIAAGASLGLSSVALEALGADPEAMARRRDATGTAGTLLEIGGALVPMAFSGGASLGARAGAKGLASTLARATPAGAATRAAARIERGIASTLGEGIGSRILSRGGREFFEGALQGAGAQVDENVLGDRELNADLLGSTMLGGLFGAGAAAGVSGLARVGSGALRAPVRGMQGILGRMNASSGGLASREVAELMVDAGRSGELSAGGKLWRDNAVRQGLDPESANRLAVMGDTAEGRARILHLERDGRRIEDEAVKLVGERLPSVHRSMDEARRLSGGESKSRYWERLGPKSPEAQAVASRAADDVLLSSRGEVERLIRENVDAAKRYGQGAQVHSVPMLQRADELLNKLESKLTEAEQLAGKPKAVRKAMAVDEYKRQLGEVIDDNGGWGKMRNATPEQRATNSQLRRMYGEARDHLEREDLWGEAAVAQREINSSYRTSAEADDLFREAASGTGLTTIVNPDGTFNATKALKLIRAHGKVGGDVTVTRLMDALRARVNHFDTLSRYVDMDDAGSSALKTVRDDVEALEREFKRQSKDAADLDDLKSARMMETNKSPSAFTTATTFAGMMGFGIGGVPGAFLGAGLAAARQPHTSLVRYAAIRDALDKADIRLNGAITGIVSAAKKLKAPDVKLPRIPTGVAGRGASKSGERQQRREQALARATDLNSSPDAIERALAVPHYDLHEVAPGLSGTMQQRAQNAAKFLQSKAPKVYTNGNTKLVDPLAEATFDRYLSAVQDPIGALERFSSGRVTGEEIEAIRVCYPALFVDIQQRVQQELADAHAEGRTIPYQRRIQLGVHFDSITDPSLQPDVASEIQASIGANYDEPDAAQAMAGANKPGGAGQFENPARTGRALQTSADRAATWRTL